ncbi:MAG: DUF6265 family protein [Steroidobacteraceae bacterium]
MKRMCLLLSMALAATIAGAAEAGECNGLDRLRWLLGDWTADGSKTRFHESWVEVAPHTFEGTGIERSKADGAPKGGEVLRLVEMAGGVFYLSKVTHNELPVAFRLTACSDGRFVFDNPAHDFPKRLEYRQEPDGRLTVSVSDGAEKGFALNFARNKAASDAGAPVLEAEDARFAAMVAADSAGMRRTFAADLVYVHSSGQVESHEQLIDSIVSGRSRYVAVQPVERQVVLMGDAAALVRGRGRFQVVVGGKDLDLQIRYLAVYGRVDGAWQLRSWQSLRLP